MPFLRWLLHQHAVARGLRPIITFLMCPAAPTGCLVVLSSSQRISRNHVVAFCDEDEGFAQRPFSRSNWHVLAGDSYGEKRGDAWVDCTDEASPSVAVLPQCILQAVSRGVSVLVTFFLGTSAGLLLAACLALGGCFARRLGVLAKMLVMSSSSWAARANNRSTSTEGSSPCTSRIARIRVCTSYSS